MSNFRDPLTEAYPQRIRKITLALTLLVTLVLYGYPRFEGERQQRLETFEELVESFDIPPTRQFVAPPPPVRPSIPVASEDEDLAEDITIAETGLESFEWEAPPPLPSEGPSVRFIPYDEPPEPVGGFKAILQNLVYPELALYANIEGTVVVQAFVDKNGRVTEAVVTQGIPDTGMDEAALVAVKKTHFKPALQRDRPIGVWIAIPIRFQVTS